MTILVGVKCSDGIVIGADSKATSAAGPQPLVQVQSNDKLQPIGNKGLIAATGAVGLSQRLKSVVDKMWQDKLFRGVGLDCAKNVSKKSLEDFGDTYVPRHPQQGIGFGALMAIAADDGHHLIEFGTTDFQPEFKTDKLFYVSIGSGQVLADPFLAFICKVLWKGTEPDVNLAKIGVCWALNHTIEHAPGGVGDPIKLGVLKKDGQDWKATITDDLQEQSQYIQELESRIDPDRLLEQAASDAPPELESN